MVLAARLYGLSTVKECLDDKIVGAFLNKTLFEEIIPTLGNTEEDIQFGKAVLERFANPFVKHQLLSIALNSVSKFKVRVLPSILEYIKRFNKMPETLLFSFAKLIEFYRTDMTNDDADIIAFMKAATVDEILANKKLWGEDLSFLKKEVTKYVNK